MQNSGFTLGVRLANALNVDARELALGEGESTTERFDLLKQRIERIERRLAAIPQQRR